MRRAILSGLTIFAWAILPLAASAEEPPPAATSTQRVGDPAAAIVAYAEGKKAYDAGDYITARRKFVQAIKQEPDNARWYYNLGLSLRQLDNPRAARQAFLKARELSPGYKKAEIDKKLADLGFAADAQDASTTPATNSPAGSTALIDPAATPAAASSDTSQVQPSPARSDSSTSSTFIWGFISFTLVIVLLIGFAIIKLLLWLFRRKPQATPVANQKLIGLQQGRLDEIAAQLALVEHAMRLGENPDLRNQLEYATRQEAEARRVLRDASHKDAKALRKLAPSVDNAATAAADASKLASELHGAAAFSGQGDAVGCFFCARPLANPDVRRIVAMKRGDLRQEVLSCPECAAQAGRGEAPGVRTGPDDQTHWSEQPGFDPYASRHGHQADGQRIPVWQLQPARPLADIARAASGGLLSGSGVLAGAGLLAAGTAVAAPLLLDLDAARQAGLAREALQASARQASNDRSSSFSDHS